MRLLPICFLFLFSIISTGCSSAVPTDCSTKNYLRKPTPTISFLPKPPIQQPIQQPNSFNVPYTNKNANILIVIDPGHGGDDYGTHSSGLKFHEKNLNLTTSRLVKKNLIQLGYKVAMTRHDDTYLSLDERASFANNHKPALFVSIHYNSAPSTTAHGIEIFYYHDSDDKSRTTKSKSLAHSVLNHVITNTNFKSRGIKQGDLAVIRKTDMPAILIEGGFMTNVSEMEKIKTTAFQNSLATGITNGIQEYLNKK